MSVSFGEVIRTEYVISPETEAVVKRHWPALVSAAQTSLKPSPSNHGKFLEAMRRIQGELILGHLQRGTLKRGRERYAKETLAWLDDQAGLGVQGRHV